MAQTKRTDDRNDAASPTDDANDPAASRSVIDRRTGIQQPIDHPDRRSGIDRRDATGLKRLRGPGRRRPEFNRAAEEGEFNTEQFMFVAAIDAFKRANNKSFPTWTEVLEVIRRLGYRKTAPMELNLPRIEDWTEAPDAPAFPEPSHDVNADPADEA